MSGGRLAPACAIIPIKLMFKKAKEPSKVGGKKWVVLCVLAVSFLVMVVAGGVLFWFYNDKALPNIMAGSVEVGERTKAQIEQLVQQQQSALGVTFVDDTDKAVTVPAKDLGLVIDVKATVKNVMGTRRSGDF